MKRSVSAELQKWKESPARKPLVLKGVRQCGKTYILKEFGAGSYPDVAYFNFEETPVIAGLFERDYDVRRILTELGLFRGKTIEPGRTLVIFDEIQECGRALTSLKYFCENAGEYHIACAGSLLGIAIHNDRSFPVGKVDFLTLYPMSFYEFLAATGSEQLAEYLEGFVSGQPLSGPVAGKLETALRVYYTVGGMPEAVKTWRDTNDLGKTEAVQRQILAGYELDFVKHATAAEFPKLKAVWEAIPQQLARPTGKFIFSQVRKGWRARDLEDALQWLTGAGLVYKVCRIEKPFLPLSSYADAGAFKLYMADVGLLRSLAGVPARVVLEPSALYTEFRGAVTENFVLNELVKSSGDRVYYWTSGNEAEVDFVVQQDEHVIPIEVKSAENVRAKSLAEYRKRYAPEFAVLTSMQGRTGGKGLIRIPLYMMASLRGFVSGAEAAGLPETREDPRSNC